MRQSHAFFACLTAASCEVNEPPVFSAGLPVGSMIAFAGVEAPNGWLICDGSEISRAEYQALFLTVAETYGRGDGVTTFRIPDLQGRTIVGAGHGAGLTTRVPGDVIGAETHTLTVDEMPSHSHKEHPAAGTNWYTAFARSGGSWPSEALGNTAGQMTEPTGRGQAHNNMQPSLAVTYIIRAN